MKKFLEGICCLLVLFSSCRDREDEPKPAPAPSEELTVLAYLVANNNLDNDLLTNIYAMCVGLASMDEEATLLVYWDGRTAIGPNNSKHLILKYQTDGKGNINGIPTSDIDKLSEVLELAEIVKEYPAQYSVDKKVMAQVMKDMIAQVSTDKIGLVFGSHGSSWLNTIYTRSFGQDGAGSQQGGDHQVGDHTSQAGSAVVVLSQANANTDCEQDSHVVDQGCTSLDQENAENVCKAFSCAGSTHGSGSQGVAQTHQNTTDGQCSNGQHHSLTQLLQMFHHKKISSLLSLLPFILDRRPTTAIGA